jgi:hypothetical protein
MLPCPCTSCPDTAYAREHQNTRLSTTTSTRDNSTIMAPIDDAVAAYKSQSLPERSTLKEYANYFEVDRSTLGRRVRGVTRSKPDASAAQQKLNPQQEHELVLYIEQLTKRGLPSTRPMIQNFAATIAQTSVSKAWVSRFIDRNSNDLITKWTAGMDAVRHQADSSLKYKLYCTTNYCTLR